MAEDMSERRALLDLLRAAVRDGRAPEPAIRGALAGVDDPVLMRKAGTVLAGLPPDTAGLPTMRIEIGRASCRERVCELV